MKNNIVKVELAQKGYDIIIGDGTIENLAKHLKHIIKTPKLFLISDKNTARLYLTKVTTQLKNININIEQHNIILNNGEAQKSFVNFEKICTKILAHNPDRDVTLIALGGGVVGDITGFVASVLLRGVQFIQIPTTLLAQVDSSVGGKTAINSKYGKNLIGTFHQPAIVLADVALLQTLPMREYLCGYAEIVKYAFINNAKFFAFLEKNKTLIKQRDPKTIAEMVKVSCQSKAEIVSLDEKEQGQRALLNLGHTFAHALEKENQYKINLKHGEAVSIGIVMAFGLAKALGYVSTKDEEIVREHFAFFGLPTSPLQIKKRWNAQNLLNNMYQDKKTLNGKLNFILPTKIGQSVITKNVDHKIVLQFIKNIV